jgi:hypothetical protein
MYSTLKEVRDGIMAKLNNLVWTWKPLSFVYPYHKIENEGYPYASFEPLNLNSLIDDTANNERTFWFEMIVYQEFNTISRGQSLDILTKIFDTIINEFDKDYTMWNNVIKIDPVNAQFEPLVSNNGKVYICIFTINVTILKNIT